MPDHDAKARREQAHERLHAHWEQVDFDALSRREQEAIALFWLDGDVNNGGIDQYFFNSSGDLAPLALTALARLGADRQLALLQSAIGKLGVSAPDLCCRDARQAHLEKIGWDVDAFDEETRAWYALDMATYDLALDDLAGDTSCFEKQ